MEIYTLVYSTLDRGEFPHLCGVFDSLDKLKSYIEDIPSHERCMYFIFKRNCNDYVPVDTSSIYNPPVCHYLNGVSCMYDDKATPSHSPKEIWISEQTMNTYIDSYMRESYDLKTMKLDDFNDKKQKFIAQLPRKVDLLYDVSKLVLTR